MSKNNEQPVDAKVTAVKSISAIWLVPLVAIFIGLWMVYYEWSTQGPLITIEFATAKGMQVGKTKIKARNVDIGEVTGIALNQDSEGVLVTARLSKSVEGLLREDSQFWLVSPKISHAGISGLDTLISGVYIEMLPGSAEQEQYEFVAMDDAPLTPPGTPGLHITLNSNDQFAYSKGDPIIYKGLTVGQFEDIYFNFDERIVYYNAFIKAPYHQLITTNTRFWDVSGLQIDLNAEGISVRTGNIETMLTNGVTFDVPKGMPLGEQVTERDYFDIYANYKAADDQRYKHSANFVVQVSDTIRGLNIGAPVEYRGVQIGQVLQTNMLVNDAPSQIVKHDFEIPILISLQPGRVGLPDDESGVTLMTEQNKLWIKDGLKATLKTGNLLTGSLFIELQHYDDQPVGEISTFEGYPVIPVLGNEFSQLTAKAENFMNKLNSLPLNDVANNSNALLLELTQTAKELQSVSQHLQGVLSSVENEKVSQQIVQTLNDFSMLAKDFSAGSKSHQELQEMMSALTKAMHELKPLLNQMHKQPNSLIFNPGKAEALEPKKYNGVKQ